MLMRSQSEIIRSAFSRDAIKLNLWLFSFPLVTASDKGLRDNQVSFFQFDMIYGFANFLSFSMSNLDIFMLRKIYLINGFSP